ncbi:hypothetical protein NDU88_007873 [Pleurodeles waltl]|uniref:Uncharacterized protein n=1 Tax=Pleurodeles waltl TaxID=8319 RepID=A0AAV7PR91_PLEWA|nr:hypothetical protein NDU88_007873 [Pleurodeles waltl]
MSLHCPQVAVVSSPPQPPQPGGPPNLQSATQSTGLTPDRAAAVSSPQPGYTPKGLLPQYQFGRAPVQFTPPVPHWRPSRIFQFPGRHQSLMAQGPDHTSRLGPPLCSRHLSLDSGPHSHPQPRGEEARRPSSPLPPRMPERRTPGSGPDPRRPSLEEHCTRSSPLQEPAVSLPGAPPGPRISPAGYRDQAQSNGWRGLTTPRGMDPHSAAGWPSRPRPRHRLLHAARVSSHCLPQPGEVKCSSPVSRRPSHTSGAPALSHKARAHHRTLCAGFRIAVCPRRSVHTPGAGWGQEKSQGSRA